MARAKGNPGGKVIGQIGDVNPLDHGGGVAYLSPSGPMLEYVYGIEEHEDLDPFDEGIEDIELTLYHVDLGATGLEFMRDFDWVDWADVAGSIGMDEDELIGYARSDNPMARASVVESIAGHYGWGELDLYPGKMTYGDLEERWFPGGVLAKSIGAEDYANNPLKTGWSQEVISDNIAEMIRGGYGRRQSAAASYNAARYSWRKRHPRKAFPPHLRQR